MHAKPNSRRCFIVGLPKAFAATANMFSVFSQTRQHSICVSTVSLAGAPVQRWSDHHRDGLRSCWERKAAAQTLPYNVLSQLGETPLELTPVSSESWLLFVWIGPILLNNMAPPRITIRSCCVPSFDQCCEIGSSLLSLQQQLRTAPHVFQREGRMWQVCISRGPAAERRRPLRRAARRPWQCASHLTQNRCL